MKLSITFITALIILSACTENKVCQCVDEQLDALIVMRESGYTNELGIPEICKQVFKADDTQAYGDSLSSGCPNFNDLDKEKKLYYDQIAQ